MNKNFNLPLKVTTIKRKYYIRRKPISLKSFITTNNKPGLSLTISGRLRGAARARSLSMTKGVIKVNTLSQSVQAKHFPVFTKWGKLGFKLCLV